MVEGGIEGRVDADVEEEDLVYTMRALDIAHFAEVSTPFIDVQH